MFEGVVIEENDLEEPEVFLKSISSDGLVTLEFSQEMFLVPNI